MNPPRKKNIVGIMLAIIAGVLLVGATLFVLQEHYRGAGGFVVSDVTRPAECSIKAPVILFRSGALFVTVEGQLDGDARLDITSNNGLDKRTEPLSGKISKRTIGGAEEWVDDLVVRYVPGSAKQGNLKIQMVCGKNLWDRF